MTWGNPVRAYSGGFDAFAAKLSAYGSLTWYTFLGGAGTDFGQAIAVDGSGNVYVGGRSNATWRGVNDPMRAYSGDYDAFAAKLSAEDGSLTWNTFLGGTGSDFGHAIAVDGSGNVYVGGSGNVTWGVPKRALSGSYDAFAAKLSANDGSLTWNTFLGGTGSDSGQAIAVDGSGNIYVGGYSNLTWGNPVRAYSGDYDAFAAKLSADGSLTWNTFLGGTGEDSGQAIAVDGSENVYVGGVQPQYMAGGE